MAIEKIFLRKKRSIKGKDSKGNPKTIVLDAYIEEIHSNKLDVTENPVELGANITDHAIILPKEVQLTVAVSDTPVGFLAFDAAVLNIANTFNPDSKTRSQQAYAEILELQESRQFIDIQTGLKEYKNMLMIGFDVAQDKDTARTIEAVLTFKEVLVVKTEDLNLEKDQLKGDSATKQGEGAEIPGRKNQTSPTNQEGGSVLKFITDFIGITE